MSHKSIIKQVLISPKEFFHEQVHKITTWREPIEYLSIFTLVATIFMTFQYFSHLESFMSWVADSMGLEMITPNIVFSVQNFLIIYVTSAVLLILLSFLKYLIAHGFIIIWKREATFKETYKALSYSTTPGWIGIPFFVLFSFLLFFTVLHGGWWWLGTVVSGLIFLFLEGYAVYLRTYAVSKMYHISMWKSFVSIYIFGWIGYLISIAIIESIIIMVSLFVLTLAGAPF